MLERSVSVTSDVSYLSSVLNRGGEKPQISNHILDNDLTSLKFPHRFNGNDLSCIQGDVHDSSV